MLIYLRLRCAKNVQCRNLFSYSTNDCGHSFLERSLISKRIGDTSVMTALDKAYDDYVCDTVTCRTELGIQVIPTKPSRLPNDDPHESKITTGSAMLGTTPNSWMYFFIQTTSEVAMYSASVVESDVVACLELFQATTPPFSLNTKPDWDLASSSSDWKLALL
ncbi:UNVERIFIED_CONTAM: hypothetical protein Sangu_2905700 [Sesamum angustifolium]|uniref:Uncharacterized protein n=1 Tax=Sesamum angustifolium TaxID=2727405 RepID=A0AAW2ILX2_9LAMI